MLKERESLNREVVLATPPPISHRTAEENLGLGYLAATLREHDYEVKIIDGWLADLSPHQLAQEILKDDEPLFLGFSCYRSNMERAMEVATLLRESGFTSPLVVGGFGPTFHSEEFLRAGFDIVVRGEGEETVRELARYFLKGAPDLRDIKGISFMEDGEMINNPPRPLLQDLDRLPFPDRDTSYLAIDRKTPLHILSSRGCEAHCVFCSIVAFQKLSEGSQWRQRSISNFVDELEVLAGQGVEHFKVIDDSLVELPRDGEWCKKLADEITKRGLELHLRGSIRADRVDEQVVSELKRAGFFSFSCGIESGSETALRRMGKSANLEQNVRALELFDKYGIYVQAGHILFDHGTTLEELEENYQFMKRFIWTISKGIFTEMYAADGTPFTRLLENKNLLQPDEKNLGNNKYEVQDEVARRVYIALKKWHKSHMFIYDMTIDPLSAPKALYPEEMRTFHRLSIELRERDLRFMRFILDLVGSGASIKEIKEGTEREIRTNSGWYEDFGNKVSRAYDKADLVYDAVKNPFIC